MVSPSRKRYASRSPVSGRSPKRQATSSPEEGEVADATPRKSAHNDTPPPHSLTLPPGLPAKPVTNIKGKVPFPFKKKNEPSRVKPINVFSDNYAASSGSGERSESQRSNREEEPRRNRSRNDAKPKPLDHWEPSYGHGDRGPSSRPPPVWREGHRDRDSRPRSPSARSPNRSRSPRRERHRLPHSSPPRSPEANFSPPSKNYDLNKTRDHSREYERGYDRHRDYSDRYDRRNDYDDRYYRSLNDYRGDDRDRIRRDDADRRRPDLYSRRVDSYRPQSPSLAQPSTASPLPPPSLPPAPPAPPLAPPPPPPPQEPTEPRQPSHSPPPAPPPDARLLKTSTLPSLHAPVSIAIKKLHIADGRRSPLPLSGLPAKPKAIPESRPFHPAPKAPGEGRDKGANKVSEPLKIRGIRRREVFRRTPKQELEAYGRIFTGCGSQLDYEVTTKLGEGTFGEVHKAIQKSSGVTVALKRILMHHEKEGMPVTALREIKILKALKHPCIVDILDMFVVKSSEKDPLSVYMVFPYMDHDLAGLLENERVKLQPSQIKLYMKQLLEGTEYMHRNHILHRDMKAANLLISNAGSLRIADFGLARSYDANISKAVGNGRGKERKYTNCVVTRWYRPPELLLGARQYGGEVDIWGIGCVLGEMFTRRPILPGTSDLDQLEKIWYLCGTPTQHTWPNFDALPGCDGVKRFGQTYTRRVKPTYESVGPETADLLDKLLVCNPKERITASQALDHRYFWTDPLPADPKTLPSYEASHEFDKRGHRNHHVMPGGAPPQPNKPSDSQRPPNLPPPAGHPDRRNHGPHGQANNFPHKPHNFPPNGYRAPNGPMPGMNLGGGMNQQNYMRPGHGGGPGMGHPMNGPYGGGYGPGPGLGPGHFQGPPGGGDPRGRDRGLPVKPFGLPPRPVPPNIQGGCRPPYNQRRQPNGGHDSRGGGGGVGGGGGGGGGLNYG